MTALSPLANVSYNNPYFSFKMSSLSDNLKNLNEKGCQCLYSTGLGPSWQVLVFPAQELKAVIIQHTRSGRRFNIRHFANHYARHCHQYDPYPTNLEAILDNIRVERGDDTGVRLSEALKTFDAERLKFLGRDDFYVERIQPYLERVAAAARPDRAAIITELFTVLLEPKVMAFARRNPKFEETMMAKAEELRLLHHTEYPELNKHLEAALRAYGQEPKCLHTPDEIVMANFSKLPANLFIRAEMPQKPHSTPYEGILNGTTVWQKYGYESEESLAQFLMRFSTNNWIKWPLADSIPTAIPDILHHLYTGKLNLYQALLNWTRDTKDLLVCKTVEEYKNPEATQDKIVLANFATLPDGIRVRIQAPNCDRCDWGILYPSRQTIFRHQVRREIPLKSFFDQFIDDNEGLEMFETHPSTLKEFLLNMLINKTDRSLYQFLKTWTKEDEALLLLQTPRELIDSFYTFVPCGEPLEKETADSCDCYRCKTELELKMDLALLQGQMKAALKRLQILEERNE